MVLSGVALVAALVVAFDVFVYLSLRDLMLTNLEQVLDAREELVRGLLEEEPLPAHEVAERLDQAGLRAVVRTPAGDVLASAGAPPFDRIPAGGEAEGGYSWRSLLLVDGSELFILASRGGLDAALDRLLLLEMVGTVAVIALAYAGLDRTSAIVLRPVRDVASTARRISGGRIDERLPPREEDEELRDMVSAFNDMLDALEDALARSRASEETSRRFLADAAHQLRNPVAGLRATVASMLRTADPVERDRLLDNLARESARTSRLLSSLLRVARLDRHEPPAVVSVRLDDVVADVVEHQRPLAPLHRFTVDVEGDVEADVDASAVQEALANLLDNAARHARREVRVHVRGHDGHVDIAVEDDGPGLSDADRERVFDRFVSLGDAGGSGLGLPIARGIAAAHGGTLDYRQGCFLLRLPRTPREPEGSLRAGPNGHPG
jgi:two-component system OmpR family sensor kinase